MIGSLRGTVCGLIRGTVVVDVGGVGYRVHVTADTLTRLAEGQEILLWTHLAVRENSEDLYGFFEKDDLVWFELLLTVSGVGPKSALNIVNAVDTDALKDAIARGDAAALGSAHGVGKKTAEKIVLELREKVGAVESKSGRGATSAENDIVDALISLGYSPKEARETLRAIPKTAVTTEEQIREAIKIASRAM